MKSHTDKKKEKWTWYDDWLFTIFGAVGIFGWLPSIWIPEYRWRLFFTWIGSLIMAMLLYEIKKEKKDEP